VTVAVTPEQTAQIRHQLGLDELDKLLDTARATVDPDKRLPMYQHAQMLIMQQAATLPLFNQVAVDGAMAALQGVRFDATKYYPEFYDAKWKA
jgi:ABC-type transport system substrate-binding protein